MGYLRARIARLEQENAALLKKHGRIRRQLKIKYPQRPITAAICTKTRSHRRWPRFFYSHFRGRKDVYSVRSRPKDGKTGCFPVCDPICPPRGQFGAL